MELIRKKPLSSFLHVALNIIYYFELLIFVILLGGITFSFLTSNERQFQWPVSFTNSSLNGVEPAKDGFEKVEILSGAGELFFIDANNWQNMSITYLGIILNFGIVLFVTYQLKKIVSTFSKKNPFIKFNVSRIHYIGLALVVFSVLDFLFDLIYVQYLNANVMWQNQGQFTVSFDYIILLLGLLIILIAEIFRLGVSLREESDLTI